MRPAARYRPDIDGLRAIAILAVLIFHANPLWLPGGFVGVDIFFVISGYLITQNVYHELQAGQFTLRHFYARRIRRIFPALIVVLLGSLAIGWYIMIPVEYERLGTHTLAASFFAANIQFWRDVDYFDIQSQLKPLLHLWSIGVEEQFYILWPALLMLTWRRRGTALKTMIILSAVSLLLSLTLSASKPAASFYLLPTRLWELSVGGILVFLTQAHLPSANQKFHRILAPLGFGLIVFSVCMFHSADVYPGWRAILPVFGSALLIYSSASPIHRHILQNRWMVWVGLISYPLYLWHWPLFSFARILYWQALPNYVAFLLMALSVALATLTYYAIERPIRFGYFKNKSVSLTLVIGMCVIALVALGIRQTDGFKKLHYAQNPQIEELASNFHSFRETRFSCPKGLLFNDCWCAIAQNIPVSAVIYGDSHAPHGFLGLATRDTKHNWMVIGHSACPPLVDVRVHRASMEDICASRNARAMSVITEDAHIKTVVLNSLGPYYFGQSISPQHQDALAQRTLESVVSRPDEKDMDAAELFYRGMKRTIEQLQDAGKKVVLMVDVPTMNFMPESCLNRLGAISVTHQIHKFPCAISRKTTEENQQIYREILSRLTREHPGVILYDPRDVLCDKTMCYAMRDGTMLYHDSHHLSVAGSSLVADGLLAVLASGKHERQH